VTVNDSIARVPIAVIAAAGVLSACSSLSGLGGSDQYACKAPVGVRCESVSGTYYNALQNNLPSQRSRQPAGAATPTAMAAVSPVRDPALPTLTPAVTPAANAVDDRNAEPARPLRSQARILRLWFKAYEDSDRDLHDQGFVFVQIDSGRWLVDHAQRQARDAYAPVRPPRSTTSRPGPDTGSTVGRAMPATPDDGAWSAVQAVRGAQNIRGTKDDDR
jgi:conjugal transfer pilus assembly protein TraV